MSKNKHITLIMLAGLLSFISCTSIKMAVPTEFADQATQMKVKGMGNKKISFGSYKTSKIKRGWMKNSTRRKGGFWQRNMEDQFLRTFGVSSNNLRTVAKQKFHFDMQEGTQAVRVVALEGSVSNNFEVVTRPGSLLSLIGHTNDFRYDFLATIIPETEKYKEPWKLVIASEYDRKRDATNGLIKMPTYIEEKGFVTNNTDTIYITSFYAKASEDNKGRERNMPFHIKSGYELKWEEGVVCVIDKIGRNVWMYNDLEPSEKMIVAAIASAILIRRVGN